jgi:hypothetical protein
MSLEAEPWEPEVFAGGAPGHDYVEGDLIAAAGQIRIDPIHKAGTSWFGRYR